MSVFPLLLVAVLGQSDSADVWLKAHPTAIAEYIEKCRTAHNLHVDTETFRGRTGVDAAEADIARLKKVPIRIQKNNVTKDGVVVVFKNKEAKASAIASAEGRLRKSQAILDAAKALDGQVILVPLESLNINSMGAVNIVEVVQVSGDKEARVKLQGGKDDVWLDYPTAAFVDGERYKFKSSKLAIVVGTKRYTTIGGGPRTIPRVTLIDMPEIKAKAEKSDENQNAGDVKAEIVK